MVSKNNRIKRMEDAAKRQQHFSIRKLTIGAASVLLGTTLWLGTNASVAHAETNDKSNADDDNQAAQESNTEAEQIDTSKAKVIVNAKTPAVSAKTKAADSGSVTTSAQTKAQVNNSEVQTTPASSSSSASHAAINANNSVTTTSSTTGTKATSTKVTTAKAGVQGKKTEAQKTADNTSAALAKAGTTTTANTNTDLNNLDLSDNSGLSGKSDLKVEQLSLLDNAQTLAKAGADQKSVVNNKNTNLQNTDATKKGSSVISGADNGEDSGTSATETVDNVVINKESTIGLNGKTTTVKTDSLSLTGQSGVGDYTSPNLAASLYDISLFRSLLGGSENGSTATDLSTYTPTFNFSEPSGYSSAVSGIPDTEYGYISYKDSSNNNVYTLATDKSDPGKNIYLYINGTKKATATQETTAPSLSFGGKLVITQTNGNSAYTGGTYNYVYSTQTSVGGTPIKLTRIDATSTGSDSPVTNGASASISQSGKTLVLTWNNGGATSTATWQSGGGSVPTAVTQHIWYVDATTGKVLGSKTSSSTISGSTYDDSDDGPEEITINGKTYSLVARNSSGTYDTSALKTDGVITTNNGVEIKASDLLSTPLKGTIGSSRAGDVDITTTNEGPNRIYITKQLDTKGTVTLNVYDIQPSDSGDGTWSSSYVSSISTSSLAPGATVSGDSSEFINEHTNGNQDVIFLYTPEETHSATIKYVDDDNDQAEISGYPEESATGTAGDTITFTTDPSTTISNILNAGYEYVNVDGTGASYDATTKTLTLPTYESTDGSSQNFVIHFKHKIDTITPSNPNGHDTSKFTQTVTRTIHYKYADDNTKASADKVQTLTFDGTAYYDEAQKAYVTSATSTTKVSDQSNPVQSWTVEGGTSDDGTFEAVTSPLAGQTGSTIKTGYTPTSVDPSTLNDGSYNVKSQSGITHSTANSEVTVYYGKETPTETKEKASVKIVDQNTGKTLGTFVNNQGVANSGITFAGEPETLTSLINGGYTFVSAVNDADSSSIGNSATTINFGNFDNDPDTDQSFTITLKHGSKVTNETGTSTAHVHYVIAGNDADKPAAPADSPTQTIDWKRTVTTDQVSGDITYGDWTISSTNKTFDDVTSPTVTGYTPDQASVKFAAPTVNKDQVITVVYNKNEQPTTVTYKGTEEDKEVTRTINYYDKTTGERIPSELIAGNPTTQTVTLSRTHVISSTGQDMGYGTVSADGKTFTANTVDDGWTIKSGSWDAITSPDLSKAGYTAPDKNVDAVNVNSKTKDTTVDVYYGHQTIPVTPNTPENPGTQINPNDPRKTPSTYPDGLTKSNLEQEVTRTINYVGVNDDGTTTAVNGSPDSKSTYTQTVTFDRTAIVDKVTGQILGYDTDNDGKVDTQNGDRAWIPASGTFTNVDSTDPTKVTDKDGKAFDRVDISSVPSMTVYPGESVDAVTVTYTHSNVPTTEKGSLNVIFHDDTDNVDISGVGTKTGDEAVGTTVTYTPTADLTKLENEGYVYVSQDKNIPAEIVKGATTVTIHVKHGLQPVNPSNPGEPGKPINPNDPRPSDEQPKYPTGTDEDSIAKTITRTIHYEGADQYTPSDVKQPVHFTAKGVLDKVTGKWTTPLTWSDDNSSESFDAVKTPEIPGYHVVSVDKDTTDNKNVDSAKVTHKDSDYTVTVKYAKDTTPVTPTATTGSITYVDQTTGSTLESASFGGNVGDKINYTTADRIAYYESKGYDLVSNNFVDGQSTYSSEASKNIFQVVLKHATTPVTPDNPGKPGDTVPKNPNNPNEPTHTYPDNYKPETLTKTITRDISYVYDDGNQASTPVHQEVTFTGKGVLDLVTGGYVTVDKDGNITGTGSITWTSDKDTYDAVPAIKHDSYEIKSVSETNTDAKVSDDTSVAGETVTQNNQNSTIVITLTKKPNTPVTPSEKGTVVINYVDKTTGETLKTDTETGTVDQSVDYNPQTTIDDYIKQGYKLEKNGYPTGTVTFTKDSQTYEIDLVHDTQTVDPKHPAKPGQPINPNYPDGPKWPKGTDANSLKKNGSETIHYVYSDGSKAAPDSTQSVEFDHSITYDKVTGKVVKDNGWTPSSKTFNDVTSPNINGYTPSQSVVKGDTVTQENPTVSHTVVYTENTPYVPDQPSNPTNPSNPTSPTTPTTPKQPTDASKPTEPTEPDIPDNPEPTPEHHEHHHNHHDNTPEPVRPSRPTTPTNNGYNYNFVPHSQNGGYNTNFMPHGQSVNGWNGNIGPHGEHVDANGNIIAPDGEVVGYVDAEGNPHYTKNILDHLLPQTGENNTEDIAAAVAGGMAVSIGLIGLAGVRKRRRD